MKRASRDTREVLGFIWAILNDSQRSPHRRTPPALGKMPVIEGVQCYISTSAGKLIEYTDEETKNFDETPTRRLRSCYVQAQEDMEFKISVEPGSFADDHSEATHFAANLSLDGVRRNPKGSLAQFASKVTDYKEYDVYATDLFGWVQALKFEKLDITDDLATHNLSPQNWGEIKVELYRWRRLSERQTTKHYRGTRADIDIEQIPGAEVRKVHEK